MADITLYIAAAIPILWGISHLIPTRNVVSGFGDISVDNRHIITMEWIIEGVSLIFIGLLVALVTYIEPLSNLSFYVYCISALALIVLASVSLFTGYKINFLPFKMCPIVLSLSSVLIVVGLVFLKYL